MLLDQNFEHFDILTPAETDDGIGGRSAAFTVTGGFQGVAVIAQTAHAFAKDQTVQHAQAQSAEPAYTLLTRRAVLLPFHTVIRRTSEGRIFRITSDADDAKTPKGSHLDLRMHACEEWSLTGQVIEPPAPEPTPEPTPEPPGGEEGAANDES